MLLVALLLVAAACGGSSYTGLSKPDFVKQADAICTTDSDKVAGLLASAGHTPTIDQVKTVYTQSLVPIFRDEVAKLRALKPPKADRARIKAMLDDLEHGVDELATDIPHVKSNDDLDRLSPAGLQQAADAASSYGFTVCGKD